MLDLEVKDRASLRMAREVRVEAKAGSVLR
jgi:hypothetical protein